MAYSEFTLESVVSTFQLEKVDTAGLFSEMEPVTPSEYLTTGLAKKAPLAAAIGTEKARSEMIVADVLVDLLEHLDRRISLFSGIEFSVDPESGLTGVCDFLVSLSSNQFYVEAPVIILVEAKNTDVKLGMGQCIAEMIAAQRFNAEEGNDTSCIYGAMTSGIDWIFLKLDEKKLQLDMAAYQIAQCNKILGILASMVAQKA
jgi:hypothetical protein